MKLTNEEKAAALELEARRRGMSYGQLIAQMTPEREERILADYEERKK